MATAGIIRLGPRVNRRAMLDRSKLPSARGDVAQVWHPRRAEKNHAKLHIYRLSLD